MRSGFVAGDTILLDKIYQHRTYYGCAMSSYIYRLQVLGHGIMSHTSLKIENYTQRSLMWFLIFLNLLCKSTVQKRDCIYGRKFQLMILISHACYSIRKMSLYYQEIILQEKLITSILKKKQIKIVLVALLKDCITAANRIKI